MKKTLWVVLAVGVALVGAWGYGELVRRENDSGQPLRLLAIAEEQSLALSFSRRGRLTTRVPEEGEPIRAGRKSPDIEEPGLAEDATDIERQISQVHARDATRLQEIEKLRAQFAAVASRGAAHRPARQGRRLARGEPRDAFSTSGKRSRPRSARARPRRVSSRAEEEALKVRLEKVRHFEKEGVLERAGSAAPCSPATTGWASGSSPVSRSSRCRSRRHTCASRCRRSGSPRSSSARP